MGCLLSSIVLRRVNQRIHQINDGLTLLLDNLHLMIGFLQTQLLIVVTEVFNTIVDGIRRRYHLIGHMVQEGRLHPVRLLGSVIGLFQHLTTLLQCGGQLFQFGDMGRQRCICWKCSCNKPTSSSRRVSGTVSS